MQKPQSKKQPPTPLLVDGSRRNFLRTSMAVSIAATMVGLGVPMLASAYTLPLRTRGTTVVSVRSFGAFGNGINDDTSAIQAAINSLPSDGGTVQIPAGTYLVDAARFIKLRSNMLLQLDPATILTAKANNLAVSRILLLDRVHDVEVAGGTLMGERLIHTGTDGEGGHCIVVKGCERITVRDIKLLNGWGDGLSIGPAPVWKKPFIYSKDVVVARVLCDNNRRNGISITNVLGIKVYDSEFNNTNGTKPQCGMDIEPNVDIDGVSGKGDQIWIENCVFRGNAKYGINVWNRTTNLTITRCTIEKNLVCGIVTRGVSGFTFTSNTVRQNAETGVFFQVGTANAMVNSNTFFNNYTKQGFIDRTDFSMAGWATKIRKDILVGKDTSNIVLGTNYFQ